MMFYLFIFVVVSARANNIFVNNDCDAARAKCAHRATCYKSLHAYMVDCADVLSGRITDRCPWACQRALIALTSTEHGLALSTCDCGDSDFCRYSKERIEVCRPAVDRASRIGSRLTCSVAQAVCSADTMCATAMEYYHRFCRSLFQGRKCTPRCNNSLSILENQEKAAKLRDCYCDGREDFPCENIRHYTRTLCYRLPPEKSRQPTKKPTGSGTVVTSQVMLVTLMMVVVTWSWSAAKRGS